MKTNVLALILFVPAFGLSTQVTIPLHQNHSVQIPGLIRVAVANGKIARAKALSPSTLLITAMGKGRTMVRAWNSSNREFVYDITVTPPATKASTNLERASVVKISLEFLEMNEAFGSNTGIRWPEMIQFGGMTSLQGNTNMSGLNYELTFSSAKGWIQHLIKQGWAKVLASPELYVRLGEEATFHSGGEFPVSTSSENYGKTHKHVEWKNFGLTAKVKPDSGDTIHISSDINLEISEMNAANGEGVPSLTKRHLMTKMNSLDGETVVLSGLIRESTSTKKEGLPILGSLPLIGGLFSATYESREQTELLMAVTFSMSTRAREDEKRKNFLKRFTGKGS
jgi:Flp pilus assembly secretin CpaC